MTALVHQLERCQELGHRVISLCFWRVIGSVLGALSQRVFGRAFSGCTRQRRQPVTQHSIGSHEFQNRLHATQSCFRGACTCCSAVANWLNELRLERVATSHDMTPAICLSSHDMTPAISLSIQLRTILFSMNVYPLTHPTIHSPTPPPAFASMHDSHSRSSTSASVMPES